MKKLLTLLFAILTVASTISAQETEPDYLCFEVEAGTTISLQVADEYGHSTGYTYTNRIKNVTLFYSFDKINWTRFYGMGEINVEKDARVYFKGTNKSFFAFVDEESRNNRYLTSAKFVVSKPFKCSGNIMTLIDETGETTTLEGEYAFAYLFAGCPMLSAPKLPALTLSNHCYEYMFLGCTYLTTAPELPATTLSDYCYNGMFYECKNLTTAPKLPATTLSYYCYAFMFNQCESLTIAPELPATKLAEWCYCCMFGSCKSLKIAPKLPATNLALACYDCMFGGTGLTTAPKLPATKMARMCYEGMFQSCVNLKIAPELPATTLAKDCYNGMFKGCSGLKTTPILPATKLSECCYQSMFQDCSNLEKTSPILFVTTDVSPEPISCCAYMFSNCSKLKYISVRFGSWLRNWGTYKEYPALMDWVKNVSPSGTFVQPPTLNTIRGDSYIPVGWKLKFLDVSSGDETSGNETIGYFIRVAESSKDYITTSETMEIEAGSKIYVAVIDRTYEGYAVSNLSVVDGNQNPIAIENEGAVYSFTMPAEDVSISVSYTPINYTINTDDFSTVNKSTANVGDKIAVTISERDGYELVSATYNGNSLTVANNKAEFIMPAANVEIKTNYLLSEYNITTDEFVMANKSKATINDKVSFTIADRTADGYKFEKVLVNNVVFSGRELDMKNYLQNVDISAVYSKINYTIIADEFSSVDKTTANVGDKVTVTVATRDGYKFVSATYNDNPLSVANNTAEFIMPAANVEIKANYSIIEYDIATDDYITPNKSKATINDKISFTVADRTSDGYKFEKVMVNNVEFTGREIDMKDYLQDVEIKAVYSKIDYFITTDEYSTVDKNIANVGDIITITIADRDGYNFVSVTYNGQQLSIIGKKVSFAMPAANVEIKTNYSLIQYSVYTSEFVSANKSKATINDIVSFSVADRTSNGYKLEKVLVNDVEFTGREIDVKDYLRPISISAVYSKIGYTITTDEFSTVNKTTANVGDNVSVTIKNRDGYNFVSATYNGKQLNVSYNWSSFTMPAANVEIKTNYSIIEYNITTNEFVTSSKSKATINDKVSFTVADRTAEGYKLDKVLVNDVEFAGREIDIKDYFTNITISAVYSKIGYTITTDGFSTVNKTTANVGDNISVTIKNRDGYKFMSASYNGISLVVSNNKASFSMPAANVEINTAYSIIEYNVTTNEFVTANKSKATINDKVSFSVADRTIDGYKLDKVLVNNVEFTGWEIDMKDYLQNVTISAVYSKIGYSITTDEFTTVNKTTAYVGDKITFTVADRTIDGYKLDKVLVNNVEFSGREINMKDYLQNVTITAVYSKIYNEDLFVSDMDMEVETNSYCAGDILNMTFKTNNIAKKYQILFAESAKSDGFKDTDFEDIVTPEEQSVSFEIPKTAKYGKYQGFIKVVDLYGNVSEKYPFDFNIGYPNDIIETKYSDLICVNNFKNNYTAYQWLKNGKEIVGANKQFFIDYPMLNGVYSVIVTDKGGNKIRVCDFKVKDLTSKKSTAMAVKVYPNPAISSQPVTIAIDGFEENTKYEIVIYNQLGALVQRLPNAQETNIIRLQSGVYSGAVVSQKGKQTFKLIISD
ncbi:MAG: T9SS type A sorting domain-containing protein [Bacteroidales bacterium]|nr:T9SS type A sorting domain-containing protein [Bacteroidales bacterium]